MRQEAAIQSPDAAAAHIAARQHGVLSSPQLHACGIDPSGIKRRVAAGRLHRVHRGVYAVGHPNLSKEGLWMGAVLACGDGAVLSHLSAGELWGMIRRARTLSGGRGKGLVDITVRGDGGRASRQGIRLHRSRTLSQADCTRRAGIPITGPARTLEDLRRVLPSMEFEAVLREAEYLHLPIGPAFRPDRTRSELEARFLSLIRRNGLSQPEVNVRVDRYTVDFLWRTERLIVELDGWESHRSRSAFEQDRARDNRLKLLGYGVLRFTWRQIDEDGTDVARVMHGLLRR